jgi:membrane protein DedA with SNARE-associated domain
VLAAASATDALVTLATHIIRHLGLGGVSLMTFSSAVVVVPGTEPTMLFAGFNVYQHHLTLLGIIVFGLIGDLVGASVAHAIGYYGSDALAQHGSKIHMGQERLDIAHRWFERYGTPVVIVSRCVPLVRAVFPYAAGVSRMPYRKFLPLAALGSLVWITGLGVIGRAIGSDWPSWRTHLQYVDYVVVVLLLGAIAYLLLRRRRSANAAI